MDRPRIGISGTRRRSWYALAAALVAATAVAPAAPPNGSEPARLRLDTDRGTITIELRPDAAPRTVARLAALVRARRYDRSQVCESRAGGFLVFGCAADGTAVPSPPGWPDEIDPRALGLDRRPVGGPREIDLLWQLEIYPRYRELREAGRPVPEGLERLVGALRERGTAGASLLLGKSRLWYLHAIGYRYVAPGSGLPLRRGSVATAALWPGEGDARFLVALSDLPEREGRATVFGRVIEGWEALSAIAGAPVDKSHRPVRPIVLERASVEAGSALRAAAGPVVRDSKRTPR